MFCLTVLISTTPFRFIFKEEKTALTAKDILNSTSGKLTFVDDYGQELHCYGDKVAGFVYEDMDKSELVHIDLAVRQERMQVKAQKAAASDPALRMSKMANSPGVISPFPRN